MITSHNQSGEAGQAQRAGKNGRTYAIRFRALGRRKFMTLGSSRDGWTQAKAEAELANVLADVRRGIWRPPAAEPAFVEPESEPTLHVYASGWIAGRRADGVKPRTIEALTWALSNHLLAHFGQLPLSAITTRRVDEYRRAKVQERDDPKVERPLSDRSINQTLQVLAQVLDAAIEDGYVSVNQARGKRRRLKAAKPRRTWLEIDELRSLLDAAGLHRPMLATMALAGLRVGEACALSWSDVDLARALLHVTDSKTEAGVRTVELSPDLLGTLKIHRANSRRVGSADPVFPTLAGTRRDRHNVRARVLIPTIQRANKRLAQEDRPSITSGITNHTLRRTFASLLYEAGASPAYVMAQMGHTSSALALEVYAKKMQRQRDTGARIDALVRGADWALMGTSTDEATDAVAAAGNGNGREAAS